MADAPAPETSSSSSEFDDESFANELEEDLLEEMDDETKEAFRRVTEILQVPQESFNTLIRSCKLLNDATKSNPFFSAIKEAVTEAEKETARKRLDEKIIQEALQNNFKDYGKKPDMKKCDCEVEHGDYIVNGEDKLVCTRCGVVGRKKKKARRSKTKRSKTKRSKTKRSKTKRSKTKRSKAKRSKAKRSRKTKRSRRSKRSR